MPGFYTHARFGEKVLEEINPKVKKVIEKYPDLFYIGLQGSDILFYYKAYKSNSVSKTGYAQHDKPGEVFFEPARKIIANAKNKEAAFSYAAGFICHFTLDSQCHPYIGTVEEKTRLSHAEIETEEERYLMIEDGKDYLRHVEADKVVINDENAEVISWFFPEIEKEEVKTSLKYVKIFSHMFCAPGKVKRSVVRFALKLAGKYESMNGMIVNYDENPTCHESTVEIARLSELAIPMACQLIQEYQVAVEDMEIPLHARYKHTFGE